MRTFAICCLYSDPCCLATGSHAEMELEERRKELYGPDRTLARDAAKRLLERDHVQQNFRTSVERQSSKLAFQSETAQSFRVWPQDSVTACDRLASWPKSTLH